MWNILSYFRRAEKIKDDLSFEKACSILEESRDEIEEPVTSKRVTFAHDANTLSIKSGVITHRTGSKYIIDNMYTFSTSTRTFPIGSKVSFYHISCSGTEDIVNVNLIDNDWDLQETEDVLWNTRIIVCKVERRENRILFLSPNDVTIDLDNAPIEFLPVVGDWLELDVKCTVDANALDLKGHIIEFNKISPVRAHIETGSVTNWNLAEELGVINRNIFFNKYSLSCGYMPVVGDRVITEVIESDQNRCSWRALKVVPEFISKKTDSSNIPNLTIPEVKDHPGLHIENVNLSFSKLNESQSFSVEISNISKENFILENVRFLRENGQCTVTDTVMPRQEILSNTSYRISCECIAKNVGASKEFLLLSFENFNVGKWINISVTLGSNGTKTNFEHKPRVAYSARSGNELVRGQKVTVSTRFTTARLPDYSVPQKLFDTISKYDVYKNVESILAELRLTKTSLFSNLCFTNYEDKFHTLLHLDEITNLIAIRCYDQDRACFIANGEYLMLEIENLLERRPSIVIGDKVIARDPLNVSKLDFEGYVHKIGAKHIYIKFSQLFHDSYKGEDYSVTVVPGRSSYKRLHHAVYLAARNLGADLLFPRKIFDRKPQISFVCEDDDILEDKYKGKQPKLMLEWYNRKLNSKQKDAVKNILWSVARPLPYIIFGPPGSGKTVTIIELVLQITRLFPHSRLLVTAPSNSAADIIARRLIESGVLKPGDLVRLVSYNYASGDSIPLSVIPYCAVGSFAREGTAVNEVLNNGIQCGSSSTLGRHRITVSTCSSAGQLFSMEFPKGHFSHIIVDEAGQAGEPDVLIPLSFLDKTSGQIVLAGDPKQLGPVVLCRIAAEYGLSESYLERLINRFPYVGDPEGFPDQSGYDPRLVTKLLYNYRSLSPILELYNSLFYNNELIPTIDNEISDEALLLKKLKDILPRTKSDKLHSVIFHGVNGENFQSADSPSWYNPHEAAQVFYYVNELYRLGLTHTDVGIITPYIKQVKEIRSLLIQAEFDVPKIGTVEEFQGQEFNVIILSTVRSCEEYISIDLIHSLGFVSSPRRLNVAISRSKSLLVIVGNPNLLYFDPYWRSVINYCVENDGYVGCDLTF